MMLRRPRFQTVVLVGLCASMVLTLVLIVLGAAAVGLSIGWAPKPEAAYGRQPTAQVKALLENHCFPVIREGRSVGFVAAVVCGTNTALASFGKAALQGGDVSVDTLFEIGSISKTFTGIALSREVERAEVRLEQPVQELLPAHARLSTPAQAITLKQLTTHSSGLPRLASIHSPRGGLAMLLFGADPYSYVSDAQFFHALETITLIFSPGSKSEYSNLGAGLLGYALAARARTNYDNLIRREVCQPLEMGDTCVKLAPTQRAHFAQGYRWVRKVGPFMVALRSAPWNLAEYYAGAGGIRSTGTDMLKYLIANMRPEGTPIAGALRQSHVELFREDKHTAFGMNWLRSNWDWSPQTIIWHNGGTGGFRTFLGFTEDGELGAMVLCNTGPGDVSDLLAIALLKDLLAQRNGKDER